MVYEEKESKKMNNTDHFIIMLRLRVSEIPKVAAENSTRLKEKKIVYRREEKEVNKFTIHDSLYPER